MPIQILPPQLANQIAAGEVVERPASVVKELVENCIDAGATKIDIEIEKGGAKLIRIRDNGCGIGKADLSLALARHATSKVCTLDDLEAILSFGFRGEALASISSVSRLTITSKPEGQTEAWQAYAEGSQMAVKVIPAAHPIGTTIDVADLFFNTPARRRFLKSDKTEFTHIDEWLKRIVLVRADIHFTLQHNGKVVRNYRPAKTEPQYIQRLAQVSSKAFAETAIKVNCQHDGLSLSGYLQSPLQQDLAPVTHYFYVNGRLVRDRLVNHAVRQAFSELSIQDQPNYVLMFELDPHQVDVNVHPAKHEVRFHQSRYIHDFILQTLQSALSQISVADLLGSESQQSKSEGSSVPTESYIADEYGANFGESSSLTSDYAQSNFSEQNISGAYQSNSSSSGGSNNYGGYQSASRDSINANAVKSYAELLATSSNTTDEVNEAQIITSSMPPLVNGEYWVIVADDKIQLLPVKAAATITQKQTILKTLPNGLQAQPLLMPVSVSVVPEWQEIVQNKEQILRKLGIELSIKLKQLIIKKVPSYIRDSQLAKVIPALLQWLQFQEPSDEELASWLAQESVKGFISAAQAWKAYELLDDKVQQDILNTRSIHLPWQNWLAEKQTEKSLVNSSQEKISE
ncbi:DNA mismatch repair endonuclease MutL [Shewanella sp. 202IG2-18]|uniref:DNA mismatch repair endonuclease MutL n=1 Tax=Parashewanella hymeniacidonis TaxID=2807618 RepID=UPI0019603AB6|nr:DNA mismatch repair endonuclease MutL [Parashewanella hymeniacidonis]MBM7071601.1 DNA mismatch repair endonuclease MutL [Parashewanella hymeniacidonis]